MLSPGVHQPSNVVVECWNQTPRKLQSSTSFLEENPRKSPPVKHNEYFHPLKFAKVPAAKNQQAKESFSWANIMGWTEFDIKSFCAPAVISPDFPSSWNNRWQTTAGFQTNNLPKKSLESLEFQDRACFSKEWHLMTRISLSDAQCKYLITRKISTHT